MKNRIYKIKDKILVRGNENELTKDEVLVKEENGSVVLKERVNGQVRSIAGGSESNSNFLVLKTYIDSNHLNDPGLQMLGLNFPMFEEDIARKENNAKIYKKIVENIDSFDIDLEVGMSYDILSNYFSIFYMSEEYLTETRFDPESARLGTGIYINPHVKFDEYLEISFTGDYNIFVHLYPDGNCHIFVFG
jgi:hypothetical protein